MAFRSAALSCSAVQGPASSSSSSTISTRSGSIRSCSTLAPLSLFSPETYIFSTKLLLLLLEMQAEYVLATYSPPVQSTPPTVRSVVEARTMVLASTRFWYRNQCYSYYHIFCQVQKCHVMQSNCQITATGKPIKVVDGLECNISWTCQPNSIISNVIKYLGMKLHEAYPKK